MIASVSEAKFHHSNINAHFPPTEKPWQTLHLKGEEMALHLSRLWLCICPCSCSLSWALWTGALAALGAAQRDLELLGFPQRGVTNLRWQDESRSISQNLSSAALTCTRGGINKKNKHWKTGIQPALNLAAEVTYYFPVGCQIEILRPVSLLKSVKMQLLMHFLIFSWGGPARLFSPRWILHGRAPLASWCFWKKRRESLATAANRLIYSSFMNFKWNVLIGT